MSLESALAAHVPSSKPANYDPDAPRHVGHAGVVTYCASKGVPVSARYVKQEVLDGRLISYRIAQRLCFSDADIDSWIRMKRDQTPAHSHNGHGSRFRNGGVA